MTNASFKRSLAMGTILGGFAIFAVAPAFAAAAPAENTVDEVVVTSLKQGAQSVQSVPNSIAVVSSDQLERVGAVNFEDFAHTVAGLSYLDNGPGDKRYIIRGINSAGEAQTALYYDNVPVTGLGGAATDFGGTQPDLQMYDVQQVEVLRGPQGTLYGSNSQSGVIRIVTNKPVLSRSEESAQVDLSGTKDGGFNYGLRAMVNIPLAADKLAIRLVGYRDDYSGFIDNPLRNIKNYNDYTNTGVRLGIKAQLGDSTTLLGQVFYQKLHSGGSPLERPYDYSLPYPPIPGSPVPPTFFPADGERQFSQFTLTPREDETQIYALTLEHDLGWSDFTLATSLFKRDLVDIEDYTPSFRFFEYLQANGAFPIFPIPAGGGLNAPEKAKMWSVEARLNTKLDGPVNGVGGVYVADRTIDYLNDVYTTDPATGLLDPTGIHVSSRTFRDKTKDVAVFGEATAHLGDKLAFTGGARWFSTTRDLNSATLIPFFGLGAPGIDPPEHSKNTGTIFKALASYNFTRDVMVYAQYAEGFRAGGTNASTVAVVPPQYDPDQTTNYEFGIKSAWLDNRLIINASAYQIDLENLQLGMTFGPGGAFSGVGNVPGKAAQSKGFEIDVTARPVAGLTLVAAASTIDAKLVKDLTAYVGPSAVVGAPLIGVPKYTYSLQGDYDFDLTGDYRGSVGFTVAHNGKFEVHRYDEYNLPTPAYTLVDVRASVRWQGYEATLYVNNLFDKNAQLNVYNDVNDPYVVLTNRPRTIGIRLGAHW